MPKGSNISIPIAIIVAGILIAGALVLSKGDSPKQAAIVEPEEENKIAIIIDKDDHILGNPDAPVTIVEFSDIDCPFCRRFHPTVQQIIEDYPEDVRWVYKHFPLDSLHPDARKKAELTECAFQAGGNEAFWQTLDALIDDQEVSEECLDTGAAKDRVQEHYQQAIKAGGQGTPYSIILGPNEEQEVVSGAVGYNILEEIIKKLAPKA